MPQTRQLAAIMFTDIVGYTALMGEDEQQAFELLKKNRALQRPIIEKFNGRWLKEIGDGVLASFPTVTDAVYCAATIQKTCEDHPELNLRIGIHQGEVVFEGSDVFGDGVNIASRLESLAPIGGILVSESVHRNLGNKKSIVSTFLREEQLKNVKEPIKIYSVQVEGVDSVVATELLTAKQQTFPTATNLKRIGLTSLAVIVVLAIVYFLYPSESPDNTQVVKSEVTDKSIAVLPFKNDSPDADNQYFADGMMDEVLNHLQKIAELGVKSRTAVEPYRNSSQSFETIAQELKVAFVLEGAVRKYGDRFRITTQLIEVESGNHLWSETYDGVFSDTIFVVQANIAKRIASSLNAVITPEVAAYIDKTPTTNIAAYDLYIKADYERFKHLTTGRSTESAKAAHDLYNRALLEDPNYVLAITGKADLFHTERIHDSALIYAERAIEIDPDFNRGYASKALYYGFTGQDNLFEEYMLKAISLPPTDDFWQSFHSGLGNFYANDRNDVLKALPYLKKGLEKEESQYISIGYFLIIRFYFQIGDYENAEYYISKLMDTRGDCAGIGGYQHLLQIQGKFTEALKFINSKCGSGGCESTCAQSLFGLSWLMGEYEKAEQYFLEWKETTRSSRRYESENYEIGYVYFQLGRKEEATQIFKKALQDLQARLEAAVDVSRRPYGPRSTHFHLSRIYAFQGERKKALVHLSEYANLGFREGWHDFILIDPFFESLREDPEFKEIVKQAQEEKAALRAQVKEMEERGELTL
jgi:TolB-like protein/class 3 adenylate cyclase/Tfp pilus assembly protein PilF